MKPAFRLACLAAVLAAAAGAQAQLKPPARGAASAPAPATAPAAAPTPAAAPAAAPANPEAENAGKLAAHAWLTLLDRRDWGTAWDSAGQAFRQTVPLAMWMDAVPKVRQPFGNLLERDALQAIHSTSLQGRPDGQYVSVMFASRFDKQVVQEVVTTVREPDGRWRVIGYSPTPR